MRKANREYLCAYVLVLCVHNMNLESNSTVLWQLQLLWLCAHFEGCWAASWRDVLASALGDVKRDGKLSQVANLIGNQWTQAPKNPLFR